jgi:porphobilinogen synthase
MPNVSQHSLDSLLKEAESALESGVRSLILFAVTDRKDQDGTLAMSQGFVLERSLAALKEHFRDDLVVMSDLCLDEYTEHGHCGVLDQRGRVDNDATLEQYGKLAVALASAGADFVAPSGMMDRQVASIREALDAAGFADCGILAYSAKYASSLYGPFRDAVEVTIAGGGDRKTYQQDFRNSREALMEVALDEMEGADMVMVKPASWYLDVISVVRQVTELPLAAYQVSGEYSMIHCAAQAGYLDLETAMVESLTSIFRAGADFVLSYFAKEAADWVARELR